MGNRTTIKKQHISITESTNFSVFLFFPLKNYFVHLLFTYVRMRAGEPQEVRGHFLELVLSML